MELKAYLRILRRKWWIVLPTFLITFVSALAFTVNQLPVYRATATFIVRVAFVLQDDRSVLSALDTLSRRVEIANTFGEVATSRLMKNMVANNLGLSPELRRGLSVGSRLLAGTNILEISAEGSDPALVGDFANEIGSGTMDYVQSLYEAYELEPLDEAIKPSSPVAPNRVLNLSLGGIFGLALGIGLAFLLEYLQSPLPRAANFGILDDETGVYNRHYFMLRLRQEMSRARRNRYPLSIALINFNPRGMLDASSSTVRSETLRRTAAFVESCLRDEDIMARLGDTVFALMLPDIPGDTAIKTVEILQTGLDSTPLELEKSGVTLNVDSVAGVVAVHNGVAPDELLSRAQLALEDAQTAAHGKVSLYSKRLKR